MYKPHAVILMLLVSFLTACSPRSPYNAMTDDQLERLAASKGLSERYDLYYDVYYSRIPRRPILAPKVAEFKEKALQMAVQRARIGSKELLAALPVVQAVSIIHSIHCTPEQKSELLEQVRNQALGDEINRQVAYSCDGS